MIKTANGGVVRNINGIDIEILSHKSHNPDCNIICHYYLEPDGSKTEITLFKYLSDGMYGYEVYKFKDADSIQHYRSYCYSPYTVPKKYRTLIRKLHEIYDMIDFEV